MRTQPKVLPRRILRRTYSLVARPLVRALWLHRTVRCNIAGVQLTVPAGVFHPGLFESSRLLVRHLAKLDLKGKRLLDMGTGSGVVGIHAEKLGAAVLAVDISPCAVRCAEENAARNSCKNIALTQSDLFQAVPRNDKFDIITWNPPFYPEEPKDEASFAWYAGREYQVIRRFISFCCDFLQDDGKIILVLSTDMDLPALFGLFQAELWKTSVAAIKRGYFEELIVVELSII